MKTLVNGLAVMFTLLFFGLNGIDLLAFDPPCPTCGNGTWQTITQPVNLETGCPGCVISEIEYMTRNTTGCPPPFTDYYDVQLISYKTTELIPGACTSCNEELIHSTVTAWLISDGGLPLPGNNDCNENYKITEASCWRRVVISQNPIVTQYTNCGSAVCCWKRYRVCADANGNITSYWVERSSEGAICYDGCISFCSPPTRQASFDSKVNSQTEAKYNCKSFAAPNPSEGNTKIHFSADFKGTIRLAVFDINGNTILVSDLVKNSNEMTIPVNLTGLTTGTYLYHIYIDDDLANSGSFSLSK